MASLKYSLASSILAQAARFFEILKPKRARVVEMTIIPYKRTVRKRKVDFACFWLKPVIALMILWLLLISVFVHLGI